MLLFGQVLDRELILCKVSVSPKSRPEVVEIAETVKAEVADVGVKTLTLLLVGDQSKIKTFLELLKPYGVKEIVRTGRVALARDTAGGN